MRFLDAPSEASGGKQLTKWTASMCWSHLEPLVALFQQDESVMRALYEFCGWCLQSLREEMESWQVGFIGNLIVQGFQRHLFLSALECASILIDVFGKKATEASTTSGSDNELLSSLQALWQVLSQTIFQLFRDGNNSPEGLPDLVRSFYEVRCVWDTKCTGTF